MNRIDCLIESIRARTSSENSSWNQGEIEVYMHQVVEYREKLLVLIHITSGQPARAPELLSVRHSNTIKREHRDVFVEDGLVVLVTRYHKGYAISGDFSTTCLRINFEF